MSRILAVVALMCAGAAGTGEHRSLVLGMGSFFRARNVFKGLTGVTNIELGYAGGFKRAPSYEDVRNGGTGHAESIRIEFDSDATSARALISEFFANHDPSQRLRQGLRIGTQYRSLLCWRSESEKLLLEEAVQHEKDRTPDRHISTEVTECDTFWPAEDDVERRVRDADARGSKGSDEEAREDGEQRSDGPCASGGVVLKTDTGAQLKVCYLPQYSSESVDYLKKSVAASDSGCKGDRCQFYRCEKGFLLQGRLAPHGTTPNRVKGPCPEGAKRDTNRNCPAHDPDCGCHGPIMHPYMVGWAGGSAGPDFFIFAGDRPATYWSHDHTVWGQLADEESKATLHQLLELPIHTLSPTNSMKMLDTPLQFRMTPL